MEKSYKEQLLKELAIEGASQEEAEDLLLLAQEIKSAVSLERSFAVKRRFLEGVKPLAKGFGKSFWPKWIFVPAISFVLFLLVGTASIVKAQSSIPGDSLYSVKRFTEKIYSAVNPQFKNEILVRRSKEIKELVTEQKNPDLLKTTIEDYKKEIKDKNNYIPLKIEESQKILEEAQREAEEKDKEEIKKAIQSKETKDVKGDEDLPPENYRNELDMDQSENNAEETNPQEHNTEYDQD